jgi:hypothetical protein
LRPDALCAILTVTHCRHGAARRFRLAPHAEFVAHELIAELEGIQPVL